MNNQESFENEILAAYKTATVDYTYQSNLAFKPEFIFNDVNKGKKVLVSIEEELEKCDEFMLSVAFITKSGITPLLQVLKDLESKHITGKILTTDYLCFSEPEAIEKLASLSNIEVKMFITETGAEGFHTKGYLFRLDETYHFIIGSSNLTLNAITKNNEWNTKFVSLKSGELAKSVLSEFDNLWNSQSAKKYSEVKESYREKYQKLKMIKEQQKQALKESVVQLSQYKLQPNKMQVAFINSLIDLRKRNIDKALLLSATGTGKSYASAFAARELNANKVLFVVHREQIAKQAKETFSMVFGSSKEYGLISGNSKEFNKDFIFSTMQMMSKPEVYSSFKPDEFDYIVLDECHHAGSDSYQTIMNYFKPKFWLGMTASPDTNNYDIYSLFDHNIAYEIRLQQALEEDLLCPFHYFGITDIEVNGETFDDNSGLDNFKNLVSVERVKHIIEKAEYYGYSGDRVKGIIFCSRREEAKELSNKFNFKKKKDGSLYKTTYLTGEDSQEEREKAIYCLTEESDPTKQLDYIFTVDIFNEGVDIPEINQVIMLRPTQSPVVFVQQLGRGLRKSEGKEFVVILDFIGNYTNNFMIPIALSGDRSYVKDNMRRYISEGSKIIPGSSSIHFDEVSKRRIYNSIDKAKTNDMKLLKESYTVLKNKLGRIPTIAEFKQYGSIDITKIFDKCGSYHAFLKKYEPEYSVTLNEKEEEILEYFSKKLVEYKRPNEIKLLRDLISHRKNTSKYVAEIQEEYGVNSDLLKTSIISNLTNQFPIEVERKKYKDCVLIQNNNFGHISLEDGFNSMLDNDTFRAMVEDILEFANDYVAENYKDTYKNTAFKLYQKYNYEDVCRLLNWEKNLNAQNIGGYFYDKNTKTLPVFINYDKADDAIKYEDHFVTNDTLIALSKHPRKADSADADHIFKRKEEDKNNKIYLFVRKNKNDNEAKEFYFLGEIFAEGEPNQIYMDSTNDNAFEIRYRLDVPVRNDIYDYIVNK